MTTQTENTKAPTHTIYVVEAKEGNTKSEWHKVGVAWAHSDQEGMNLSINALGAAFLQTKGADATLTVRRNKLQE